MNRYNLFQEQLEILKRTSFEYEMPNVVVTQKRKADFSDLVSATWNITPGEKTVEKQIVFPAISNTLDHRLGFIPK